MQATTLGRSLLGICTVEVLANACAPSGKSSSSGGLLAGNAAERTYVPPGSYDEWDDAHHTEMSLTNGVPDGSWLFINGNNTPRIARIDLKKFETEEILQIPNASGGHASPFATPDTKYVVSATRFSVPIPPCGDSNWQDRCRRAQ